MDLFAVHRTLINDYRSFTQAGTVIRDETIAAFVENDLNQKSQWPDPWLSLNPFFASAGTVLELADGGVLHPEYARIFREEGSDATGARPAAALHQHQRDAIGPPARASPTCSPPARVGQVPGLHRPDRRHVLRDGSRRTGGSRRSSSIR